MSRRTLTPSHRPAPPAAASAAGWSPPSSNRAWLWGQMARTAAIGMWEGGRCGRVVRHRADKGLSTLGMHVFPLLKVYGEHLFPLKLGTMQAGPADSHELQQRGSCQSRGLPGGCVGAGFIKVPCRLELELLSAWTAKRSAGDEIRLPLLVDQGSGHECARRQCQGTWLH